MSTLKEHHETLVVGAGPAGLAASIELYKHSKDFAVIEKAEKIGGLSRTYVFNEDGLEFRTDNGPHRFFSKNQYLYDFIEDLLQENWITVRRQTRQFIDGKFFDYPINAVQVIKNIGPVMIFKAAITYMYARIKYGLFKKPIRNFYDYAIANFGTTLAYYNIIGYTEKIWGTSTKNLHADWAKQRIAGLNLVAIAKNALKKVFGKSSSESPKSLVETFYYPEWGTGLIYDTIGKRLTDAGHAIVCNSFPTRITHEGDRITGVEFNIQGEKKYITTKNLVESIHIDDFLPLLDPLPPEGVLTSAKKLKYRSQVHLFITLNKPSLTNDQWIYFPDKDIPFARVSEMRNFSIRMSPEGKTSLFVEFFCNEGDSLHKASKEELFELALPHFERYGFFTRKDVRNVYFFKGGKDYPVYDLGYKENLAIVKKYLDSFVNLQYIGRPGRFKYTNQDHSLEMGILAAKNIIEGSRHDIEDVGAEKEYFESGYIKLKSNN